MEWRNGENGEAASDEPYVKLHESTTGRAFFDAWFITMGTDGLGTGSRGKEGGRTDGSRGKKKSINLAPRNVTAREENEKRNSFEACKALTERGVPFVLPQNGGHILLRSPH